MAKRGVTKNDRRHIMLPIIIFLPTPRVLAVLSFWKVFIGSMFTFALDDYMRTHINAALFGTCAKCCSPLDILLFGTFLSFGHFLLNAVLFWTLNAGRSELLPHHHRGDADPHWVGCRGILLQAAADEDCAQEAQQISARTHGGAADVKKMLPGLMELCSVYKRCI